MKITLIAMLLLFGAVTLAAEHDCETETASPASPPTAIAPTSIPEPTATPESKFNCRDLELEYRTVVDLGYEFALMHVSNIMYLEDGNPLAHYTSGDAERELQNCGVIPR